MVSVKFSAQLKVSKKGFDSWKNFLVWLKEHGLSGVQLIIGDKALGVNEAIAQVFESVKIFL